MLLLGGRLLPCVMGLVPHGAIAAQETGVVPGGRLVQGEEAPPGLPGLPVQPVGGVRGGRGPRLLRVSVDAGGGEWGDRRYQADGRSGRGRGRRGGCGRALALRAVDGVTVVVEGVRVAGDGEALVVGEAAGGGVEGVGGRSEGGDGLVRGRFDGA